MELKNRKFMLYKQNQNSGIQAPDSTSIKITRISALIEVFWTPGTVFEKPIDSWKTKTATKRVFNCLCRLNSPLRTRVILQLDTIGLWFKLPEISCRLPQWGVFRHRMRHVIEERNFMFSKTSNTQGSQAPDSTSTLNRVIARENKECPIGNRHGAVSNCSIMDIITTQGIPTISIHFCSSNKRPHENRSWQRRWTLPKFRIYGTRSSTK